MRDEESFMVQMIKGKFYYSKATPMTTPLHPHTTEEGGRYQIILRDHPYTAHEGISMQGATTRH